MVDWLVSYFKGCAWGIRERERRERNGRRWLNARECLEVSLISGDTANRAPSYPLRPATLPAILWPRLSGIYIYIYDFLLPNYGEIPSSYPQNSWTESRIKDEMENWDRK